jgi:hypothetical protein
MEVDFFTFYIKNEPVMSRSYFKQLWVDCGDATTLDITDEGAINRFADGDRASRNGYPGTTGTQQHNSELAHYQHH